MSKTAMTSNLQIHVVTSSDIQINYFISTIELTDKCSETKYNVRTYICSTVDKLIQ